MSFHSNVSVRIAAPAVAVGLALSGGTAALAQEVQSVDSTTVKVVRPVLCNLARPAVRVHVGYTASLGVIRNDGPVRWTKREVRPGNYRLPLGKVRHGRTVEFRIVVQPADDAIAQEQFLKRFHRKSGAACTASMTSHRVRWNGNKRRQVNETYDNEVTKIITVKLRGVRVNQFGPLRVDLGNKGGMVDGHRSKRNSSVVTYELSIPGNKKVRGMSVRAVAPRDTFSERSPLGLRVSSVAAIL